MILESIAIQDFRKLADKLVIDRFEPGLNIIAGPNEAGKSTIAEAIRTVFLERYKVSTLGAIVPAHRPDGQPTVEVKFSVDGVPHVLKKSFVRKSRCELRIGTQSFAEDEAEEKLAELLGFSRSERGASKPEHAGIPGLLWVRQGQTDKVRDSGGHAFGYVRDALSQLSGGDASGGEDGLIRAVSAERGKLLTKTSKTTGALAQTETELAAKRRDRDALSESKLAFDEDINRLASLQAEHDDAKRKKPWEALEQKAALAQERAKASAELERVQRDLLQQRELVQSQHANLMQQEQAARDLEQAVDRDRRALQTAQATVAEASDAHQRASLAVADAQKRHDESHAAHELANAAVTASDLDQHAKLYRADIACLDDALTRANTANADIHALTEQAARVEIDAKKLKRLRVLAETMLPLLARKDAALTRIEYRLSCAITVDGVTLKGSGELLLESEKTLNLPGLGELIIKPGESDLSALIDQLRALESEHARLLLELGVSSVADANLRHEKWQQLTAEKATHARMLEHHAPKGIESLRDELVQARARLAATDERRAKLPDVAHALPLADAKSAFDTARIALENARAAQVGASEKKANASAGEQAVRERLGANEARLADPAFVRDREVRQVQFVEKDTLLKGYARELDECGKKLSAAQLDDPAAEAKRYAKSADILRQEQADRQNRIAQLRGSLEARGAEGIGEKLALAEASVEQIDRRHQQLRLRADALDLLESVLVKERDTAIATLRAPLTQRLGLYLKRVFPAGELSVDDGLTPVSLARGEQPETLDSLSFGTQEQLGILARLAYADLLQAAGRPTLLLFDDAVVHTDDARREGIKRALLEAAKRHQILVLTCHPMHWDDLGVKQRHLADLQAASRA
ncbi:DNA double-strand break repair Rad50 ATPase [Candidatus Burkholderia verschuerenii]|uniref:DNA double-strand break repair Rad50 ATPase n=1 Tax=Candidatus Burkholderia verschuerenii TaxID=242163 RepID=A0A0L0M3K3_9BURK|nr:AAA family ATPase [Candidatus Burkholderia verschuerenii]KND56845.1 DNA double-strand break repair Rad50 ATPase [Candidatus Burkholderia verschuerenii]